MPFLLQTAALIEFSGALIIANHVIQALVELVFASHDLRRVQAIVATGVLHALSIDLAATLLKASALHIWPQFGAFAIVFTVRTIVKRTLSRPAAVSPGS